MKHAPPVLADVIVISGFMSEKLHRWAFHKPVSSLIIRTVGQLGLHMYNQYYSTRHYTISKARRAMPVGCRVRR